MPHRADVLTALPWFRKFASKAYKKACGSCSKKSHNAALRRQTLQAVRESMQHLSAEDRTKLKQAMQVDEIIFYVRTPSGVERRTI